MAEVEAAQLWWIGTGDGIYSTNVRAGCTMGLLSIIRKQKIKDQEVRVLVLGLDNAGKSTIVNHVMGEDTSQVSPTMGFQIHTFAWNGCNVNAWDVGGQATLRGFWGNYFDKLDVLVWVVDGTSLERLDELYRELREKVILQDQLVGTYLAVMVNKMDLVAADERSGVVAAVVKTLRLAEELHPDKYIVRSVSGVTGEHLGEVMDWVTTREV